MRFELSSQISTFVSPAALDLIMAIQEVRWDTACPGYSPQDLQNSTSKQSTEIFKGPSGLTTLQTTM